MSGTVLHGVEAQLISRSMNDATFDSPARHPCREAKGMVIATPVLTFNTGCAAKFGSPNHNSLVQQSSLLQILQQSSDRPIHFGAQLRMVLAQLGMGIPSVLAATVKNLNKVHSPLDQAAGRETLLSKLLSFFLVKTV